MKNVITFLLPGTGQIFSGDAKKGGIMFLSAIVAGALTTGLGYFACGAWSVFDLQSRSSSSSRRSPAATLLATTDAPATAAKGGVFHAVMPWLFKFSVLGLCAVLVLYSVRGGGALQSLEAFGVRLHFASLASEAGAATQGATQTESSPGQATIDAVANALREDRDGGVVSSPGGTSGFEDPKANVAGPPVEAHSIPESGQVASFAGQWGSDLGATYLIREDAGYVEITETSKLLFVPFISMTCIGQSADGYLRAECTTYNGQTGQLVLARDAVGGLGGVFTAYANGMQIPVNLRR